VKKGWEKADKISVEGEKAYPGGPVIKKGTKGKGERLVSCRGTKKQGFLTRKEKVGKPPYAALWGKGRKKAKKKGQGKECNLLGLGKRVWGEREQWTRKEKKTFSNIISEREEGGWGPSRSEGRGESLLPVERMVNWGLDTVEGDD